MQVRAVEEVQPGLMQQAQRFFLLTQIDNLWKEHLQQMSFLRQAVSLRGYATRPSSPRVRSAHDVPVHACWVSAALP